MLNEASGFQFQRANTLKMKANPNVVKASVKSRRTSRPTGLASRHPVEPPRLRTVRPPTGRVSRSRSGRGKTTGSVSTTPGSLPLLPDLAGQAEVARIALTPVTEVPRVQPDRTPERTLARWDENSSLRLYLREAVETPLLTPAEEVELAHRVQAGDAEAREHMIKANLRLVVKIAREYEDYGLPLLDLVNEGNIGLMRAVERFDPTKGAKLSTYAAWWIKQSIKRALSNQVKAIRLPIHLVQQIAQMRRAETAFEARHGRPPRDAELAVVLNVSEDDILHWRESATVGTTSLEAPLGNDPDAGRVADLVPDDNATMPWSTVSEETNAELIRELVGTLNPREQKILRERFALDGGDPRTLEEIGVDFGLTRERIRQLEAAALRKLRDRIESRERLKEV